MSRVRKTFREWREADLAKEQARHEREMDLQRVRRDKRHNGVKLLRHPRPPRGTDEYRQFMRDYMREWRHRTGRKKDKRKDPAAYRKYAREHGRDKRGVGYITILEKEAVKLGISTRELRTRLLTILCNEGLIDAVLDP